MLIHDCSARKMEPGDLQMVLEWRNQPRVRSYMHTQHEISLAEHGDWYSRASCDSARHLLVVEDAQGPFGFAQFAESPQRQGEAVWGFYAAPHAAPGSGAKLGRAALDYAFGVAKLDRILGESFEDNHRSISLHRRLGFEVLTAEEANSDCAGSRPVVRFSLSARNWQDNQQECK